jgi:phosphoribosyl-dephospho-CoA transferase
LSATVSDAPDKKYKVTLTVQARELKSDGSGMETPMPLNDLIDVGVFTGNKDHEKTLYLRKEKFTASVITLNPAIRDRVKRGHREWPKT